MHGRDADAAVNGAGRPSLAGDACGGTELRVIVSWSEDGGWRFHEGWSESDFGMRLAAARTVRDWTQELLAHYMILAERQYGPVNASLESRRIMISGYERCVKAPRLRNLYLLGEALGIDVRAFGLPINPHFPWPPRRRARRQHNVPSHRTTHRLR